MWLNSMGGKFRAVSGGSRSLPVLHAHAPGTAIENYTVKPLQQYVVSPVEQAASYAASQLSPALHTRALASLPQVNPLMIGMFPSELLANTLVSSPQPYLNTGAQDINNSLSGLQGGINQWASTPYNPGNPLSAPYLENAVGGLLQNWENFFGNPVKSISSLPGQAAQVQAISIVSSW